MPILLNMISHSRLPPVAIDASPFDIDRKKNDALEIFNADTDEYEMWHNSLMHHVCRNCSMWRAVLEFCEKQTENMTKAGTLPLDSMGVTAWNLSIMLERFLCSWINDKLYRRRKSSCGGRPGKGFELWRRMRVDDTEGSIAVRIVMVGALNNFPSVI